MFILLQKLQEYTLINRLATTLSLIIILLFATGSLAFSQCNRAEDSLALVALYNSTNGNNWTNNTNWLVPGQSIDTWYGVSLNGDGCVVCLDLGGLNDCGPYSDFGNNLVGSIPPEIGNFSVITNLNLAQNQLSGSIPSEIGNLTYLEGLFLFENQLSGAIPASIGNLTSLQGLNLAENQLTGAIPSTLSNLSELQGLDLADNQLSGSIPTGIGNLTNLIVLLLANNQLSGSIPSGMGNLTNLEYLNLEENQLTGSIPTTIGNLTNLWFLSLFNNELSGNIPSEIGNLVNLQLLFLAENQLSGSIPLSIGNLTNLQQLALYTNQLTGEIPVQIGNLNNLQYLDLARNQLSGTIPVAIGSISSLEVLILAENQLTGSIPNQLGNLSNLQGLNLADNQLSNAIPTQLGNLSNLVDLLLASNQLTSTIPVTLGNLSNIEYFNLEGNQLTGSIPPELGGLTTLTAFYLDFNQLSGTIPPELGNLTALTNIDLSNNQLEGCYPPPLSIFCSIDYSFFTNPLLPWEGDFSQYCSGLNQIGASCDDGNPLTFNDVIIDDCSCVGSSAPECTYLLSPLNGASDVSIDADLSWGISSGATGYKLSVGTVSGGGDILANQDVGNVTTYDLGILPCNAIIYVTIIPYNDYSENRNCDEEYFTTTTIIDPIFTIDNSYCEGEETDLLPTISDNGITGTWSPSTINNTTSGSYVFSPSSGCANEFTLNVAIEATINPIFTIDNSYCEGEDTDLLPTISDNGIAGTWSPNVINNTTSGSYVFSPSGGCADDFLLNVTIFNISPPTNPQSNIYCYGESPTDISVESAAGQQVNWYNANGTLLSHDNPFTPLEAGSYFASYEDIASGCESETLEVSLVENPAIIILEGDFTCSSDLATYDLNIEISGGAGGYTVTAESYVIIDSGNGNYTIQGINSSANTSVAVTDANNCSVTFETTEQSCDCPDIALPTNPQGSTYCFGESHTSIVVDAPIVGQRVDWYDASGSLLSHDNPFTPLEAGSYFASYEDIASGCESETVEVILAENPAIIILEGDFTCSSDLATYDLDLEISGGSGGYMVTTAGSLTVLDSGNGIYTIQGINSSANTSVAVTDANNCSVTFETTEQSCDCPSMAAPTNLQNNTFCYGAAPTAISVSPAIAGQQVNWYDASGTYLSHDNPFVPTIEGTYFASYEDIISGCKSDTVAISLVELPQIIISQGDFTCSADLTTYDLDIEISGGSGGYTVTAGSFATTDSGNGNYTIQEISSASNATILVTDESNCSATFASIAQNCDCPNLTAPTNPQDNTYCYGTSPSTISVEPAIAGQQVNWYDVSGVFLSHDNPFLAPVAGTYYASYEEIASGCESPTVAVTLTEDPPIIFLEGDFTCASDLATYDLDIEISGGTGSFTVTAGSLVVIDSGNGNYTIQEINSDSTVSVFISDSSGCEATFVTSAQQCDCLGIVAPTTPLSSSFCDGASPSAISVDAPIAGQQVNWYDVNGIYLSHDNPFTPSVAGTYYASYEEITSGCESDTVEVTLTEQPPIIILQGDFTCSADLLTYDLNVEISGGVGGYLVTAGSLTIIDSGNGNYTIQGISSADNTIVEVTDANGCSASLETIAESCDCISITPPTNAQGNTYCAGATPTAISVEPAIIGQRVNWYDANGIYLSHDNPFTPSIAGTYYASYEEIASGCESDTVEVTLTEQPPIIILQGDFTCSADLLTYDLNVEISGGVGGYMVTADSLTIIDSGNGNYTIQGISSAANTIVEVTDANGCSASLETVAESCDCVSITSPTNAQGNTYCAGATPTAISVEPAIIGQRVNWYDANGIYLSHDNPFTPSVAGTYYVSYEEITSGCESDTVEVVLEEIKLDFNCIIDAPICAGEQGHILIDSVDGGVSPYFYSIDNGNTFVANSIFTDLNSGTYQTVVQDVNGCESTQAVVIPSVSPITLVLESSEAMDLEGDFQINTQINISLQAIDTLWWTPVEGLSCADCLDPLAHPSGTTSYQLTVVDTLGCMGTGSVLIQGDESLAVYAPTAFSPNGDAINDKFVLFAGKGVKKIQVLQIFDRWGNMVFEIKDALPNDEASGWNGAFQGQVMDVGVYIYSARIEMSDGRVEIIDGDTMLLK